MSDVTSALAPIFYQQDGALPHFRGQVRAYLSARFSDRLVRPTWSDIMATSSLRFISTRLFLMMGLLRMKCTCHLYLQMLIYGQELQAQLKKLRQTCFITPGKKFIVF
jgi:hypothetical protein